MKPSEVIDKRLKERSKIEIKHYNLVKFMEVKYTIKKLNNGANTNKIIFRKAENIKR